MWYLWGSYGYVVVPWSAAGMPAQLERYSAYPQHQPLLFELPHNLRHTSTYPARTTASPRPLIRSTYTSGLFYPPSTLKICLGSWDSAPLHTGRILLLSLLCIETTATLRYNLPTPSRPRSGTKSAGRQQPAKTPMRRAQVALGAFAEQQH
ncbi:hypothetical protein F4823DRAFT_131569 [Ustulina deusta]|nr:hypothetical protein F4823DRAFT_131569 [Ustulina deusta]